MKIHILTSGPYLDLNNPDRIGKLKAVNLKAGDIVEYDPWYAQKLLDSGMAASMTPVEGELVDVKEEEILEEVPPEEKTIINVTDAALRIFDKYGIDPLEVQGSGAGGRVTAKDVMKYLNQPSEV